MRRLASKTLKTRSAISIVTDDRGGNSRVERVHRDLVLRGITNETFSVREGHIGGGRPVTLVVGDDLNTIILPDTNTTTWIW